ncbi:hypothetical protein BGZ74_004665, partial [Mortierella antarctica]
LELNHLQQDQHAPSCEGAQPMVQDKPLADGAQILVQTFGCSGFLQQDQHALSCEGAQPMAQDKSLADGAQILVQTSGCVELAMDKTIMSATKKTIAEQSLWKIIVI